MCRWYAAQALAGDSTLQQENENHRYFITVLRRVLTLLTEARDKLHPPQNEPARPAERKSKKGTKSSISTQPSKGDKIANLFALLQVDEPSSSPLGEEPPPPYEANTIFDTVSDYDFKVELDDEDPAFATWCFLM